MRLIGAEEERIQMIEQYLKAQGLYRVYDGSQPDPTFTGDIIELSLNDVVPCVSGPKRPHDRVELASMQKDFKTCLTNKVGFKGFNIAEDKLSATSTF
jgi:aconitate hydratase